MTRNLCWVCPKACAPGLRPRTRISKLRPSVTCVSAQLLSFAKAAVPSRVHRPAYPDLVSIRELDSKGKVIKECRFMGLYTSAVYAESVWNHPLYPPQGGGDRAALGLR